MQLAYHFWARNDFDCLLFIATVRVGTLPVPDLAARFPIPLGVGRLKFSLSTFRAFHYLPHMLVGTFIFAGGLDLINLSRA